MGLQLDYGFEALVRQGIEMVSANIPEIREFLKRSKFNEFLRHLQIFQIVQGQKCILVNLGDVVFLQIPEKNIYYCKHNIFRSSIQMDTKDMSCFQTKLPKTKIFHFHSEKFSCCISVSLLGKQFQLHPSSILFDLVGLWTKETAILNTELMYLRHEYKLIFYDPFSLSHARNKHFSNTHNI